MATLKTDSRLKLKTAAPLQMMKTWTACSVECHLKPKELDAINNADIPHEWTMYMYIHIKRKIGLTNIDLRYAFDVFNTLKGWCFAYAVS